MRQSRTGTILAAAVLALSLAGTALAEEAAPAPKAARKRTAVRKEKTTTVTAVVEALDLANRVVTLKGPKGNIFDVSVGPRAKNLDRIAVGDEVVVTYYTSEAYRLLKPGEAPVPATTTDLLESAAKGAKPAGVAGTRTTFTATIEALDQKERTVTFKGPEGRSFTIRVKDPKNLEGVKTGDEVVITTTEAVAISVEKAGKK